MAITEYAATTARAFMAAEIAMALVNFGDVNVTRAQAEKLSPRRMMNSRRFIR